ncbi:two-component sensor histidine kinase [Bradyrhizobium sp. R2.2-H]|uniref:sensor histidine kinase n=1 Tax=unclassified Bradyrhizobium TaxID=2631580 RepID=UPI00104C45F5|nr:MULTISPECIES: sensor histidine kinase [unclassified Bradyrhizobium]TCU69486.1 two-component sensor histidine kinase [Bradyrhizobium sp. Y-H1]TCU70978.1 two-component sensor histidine kinase [Bradyrhizobium sp. R2.2-H]
MSGIGARASDHVVRPQLVTSLDDQSRDWELVLRESHHRMKNTLTLLGAAVRRDFTHASKRDVSLAVDRLERRIVAFGRLYQLLSDNDDPSAIAVEPFLEKLCGALSEAVLEPAGIRCEAAIESGRLPSAQCHRLALMLTELVTNAAKHAFPNRSDAMIRIELANRDGAWLCTVADNGIGATGPLQGTGSRILEGLARSIHARLHGEAGQGGTRVTIVMPTVA